MKNKANGSCTMVCEHPYISRFGIPVKPWTQRVLFAVIMVMRVELDSKVEVAMAAAFEV